MKTKTRPESETGNEPYRGFYPVIAPLMMSKGVGDGKTTSCVMAQAATIDALRNGRTLETPTDEMECACPVLRRIAIRLNDMDWWKSDMERTEVLRPLIPMLLDSRGNKAVTNKRVFFVADQAVRVLTPMRLDYIAKHTKSEKVKSDVTEGSKQLRQLREVTDKKSALAARDVCEKLRAYAYASADADASAYASADASAYAYASADADASADAYADASADASAYAYASAYASADADASADAYADASAYAQRASYRAALLQVFKDCSAIK